MFRETTRSSLFKNQYHHLRQVLCFLFTALPLSQWLQLTETIEDYFKWGLTQRCTIGNGSVGLWLVRVELFDAQMSRTCEVEVLTGQLSVEQTGQSNLDAWLWSSQFALYNELLSAWRLHYISAYKNLLPEVMETSSAVLTLWIKPLAVSLKWNMDHTAVIEPWRIDLCGFFLLHRPPPTVLLLWTPTTTAEAENRQFNLWAFEIQRARGKTKQQKTYQCSSTLTSVHVWQRTGKISQYTLEAYVCAPCPLLFTLCCGPNKDLVSEDPWQTAVTECHQHAPSGNWCKKEHYVSL